MVQDDDAGAFLGHALGFTDQKLRLADDADDVADEQVVKAAVLERQLKGVALEDGGVIKAFVDDLFTGLVQHAGREVDA
ncbi:MAG: hypothetical protein QM754_13010 [Tepidisphaeraceae bacterium]